MLGHSFLAAALIPSRQVGPGPVGLLVALRLAKAGIATTVLEMLPYAEQSPRAAVYHAVCVRELDRAGVLEDCRKRGSTGSDVCWRKLNGEIIAEVDRRPGPGEYEVLVLGQHELADVIFTHYNRCEQSRVLFNHKAIEINNSRKGIELIAETRTGCGNFAHGMSLARMEVEAVSVDSSTYLSKDSRGIST